MATKKKLASAERQKLSRDVVIQAAIKLTDEIGIEALSMRKLAENLNVEAMSLYNHVKNKEDLLDAMVDEVVAQTYFPDCDNDWRQELERVSLSAHAILMKHPWTSLLLVSRPTMRYAKLAHFNAIQGCFVNAGFSPQMADQVRRAIEGYLIGFTLQKLHDPTPESDYANAATQSLPTLPREVFPHAYDLVEAISAGKYDGKHYIEFGLTFILDGIQKILDNKKSQQRQEMLAPKKTKRRIGTSK